MTPLEEYEKINTNLLPEDDSEITFDLSSDLSEDETEEEDKGELEFYDNLVSKLSEDELSALADLVIEGFHQDEQSRSEWTDMIERGLDLLGTKLEERNVPFEGACSAQHPLLFESAVKFQSKASSELLPADGPVKVKLEGDLTEEKENRANRIRRHMNWQITEQMHEYYPDSERLLLNIAVMGIGFKKVYYDANLERPVSEFVPAYQFVVNNNVSDLHRAERYTHILYRSANEMNSHFANGFYIKPENWGSPDTHIIENSILEKVNDIAGQDITYDLGTSDGTSGKYTLYEQHVNTYIEALEDDEEKKKYKVASPYIVTVDYGSRTVLGIRRNWNLSDTKRKKDVIFVPFSFVPSFGFYSFGFLHLLGNLQLTLTTTLRSLVDSGQFANLQGGFKLKGVRLVDDGGPIAPGEWKEVESHYQDLSKSLYPLPFKEPSQTLFQMLNFLDAKGQKFADSTEQVIADSTNYGPVGTTLALLDASTKFFSAIHKRLHLAQKNELRLIAKINGETLPEDPNMYLYNVENPNTAVSREDYSNVVDIVPVSDPNVSSNAHRMAKAQAVLQVAQQMPNVVNQHEAAKMMFHSMDLGDPQRFLIQAVEPQQQDPLSDIQAAVQGNPIKAFEGQDHDAHIAVKSAFLNDPHSGANQMFGAIAKILQANIQEHMLLKFMEGIKAQQPDSEQAMAQAAMQVVQMHHKQVQQQLADATDKTSEDIWAEAEMVKAKTAERKQKFDEFAKLTSLTLQKEKQDTEKAKIVIDAAKTDKQLETDVKKMVTQKGLDAVMQSLNTKTLQKSKD